MQLEADLELSRRLLADAQQLARIGSWEWDLGTNVVTWSDELYRIYGHEPGSIEVSYEAFLARVHPDDRASVDERNKRCFETHEPFEDVKRILRPDASEFLMRTRGEMVMDEHGAPIRMIGVCEDVTDAVHAREADAALAASEQSRRRAMDLNDNVMQSLVLSRYRIGTDTEDARRSLNQAIAQCQRIVDELLGGDGAPPEPGSLRRDTPAMG
ncbi:MAG: sensor protein [Solirubrobacterales bacterium]|nr:sensor protein [Solirubrobacterales bacterium]